MLLGRNGLWMLKHPFTKYASNGLLGEIVSAGFIRDLVAKGRDIKTDVYSPVGAEGLYKGDLDSNCIIIMIESGGKYYTIPDKYIVNLYDGNQHFRNHYMTVKVGLLPKEYDMTEATNALAKTVSEVTGVNVLPKDIYVGVSDQGGLILSDKEGEYETLRRLVAIESNESIYSKYNNSQSALNDLEERYKTISDAYLDLLP